MNISNVKQALLNAYNEANKIQPPVTLADVTWSNPEVWLQGDTNSRVTITALPGSVNYSGTQTFYFNRRHIADDLKEVKIPGKAGDYTRFFQVLKVLREVLGVPLQDSEFIDRSIAASTVKIDTTVACMGFLPAGTITLEYAET